MADYAPTYMTTYDTDGPDVPLEALELSADEFEEGAAAGTVIGVLSNMTAGSVLDIMNNDGRVEIDGTDLVVGDVVAEVGDFDVSVRETSQYAVYSPKVTVFTITVTEAA
jgi:hypothetical protein